MEAGDGNLILLAYEEFVQDLAQIFRDVCKSNFLQLQLVVTPNLLSENRESNIIEKRKNLSHLYYYLSGAVCLSVCLSASVCVCKLFLLYGFGEQTSRILEFKPEGLDF